MKKKISLFLCLALAVSNITVSDFSVKAETVTNKVQIASIIQKYINTSYPDKANVEIQSNGTVMVTFSKTHEGDENYDRPLIFSEILNELKDNNADYSVVKIQFSDGLFKPEELVSPVSGDVNRDYKFNSEDLVLFQKWLLGIQNNNLTGWMAADINNNRKADVADFCMLKQILLDELNTSETENNAKAEINAIDPETITSVEVKRATDKAYTSLSDMQIKELIRVLQLNEQYRKNDSYMLSSADFIIFNITRPNEQNLLLQVHEQHLVINGTGFYINTTICDMLKQLAVMAVKQKTPWKTDFKSHEVIPLEVNESYSFEEFPDTTITWTGYTYNNRFFDKNGIVISEISDGMKTEKNIMPQGIFNAFFTDINGDGHPEIAASIFNQDEEINGYFIQVYDIFNNKSYRLADDYQQYHLSFKNEELFAEQLSNVSAYDIWSDYDIIGKLTIENDKLLIIPEVIGYEANH